MALFHIKRPGKSRQLDTLDTFCRSHGVHYTKLQKESVIFRARIVYKIMVNYCYGTS